MGNTKMRWINGGQSGSGNRCSYIETFHRWICYHTACQKVSQYPVSQLLGTVWSFCRQPQLAQDDQPPPEGVLGQATAAACFPPGYRVIDSINFSSSKDGLSFPRRSPGAPTKHCFVQCCHGEFVFRVQEKVFIYIFVFNSQSPYFVCLFMSVGRHRWFCWCL